MLIEPMFTSEEEGSEAQADAGADAEDGGMLGLGDPEQLLQSLTGALDGGEGGFAGPSAGPSAEDRGDPGEWDVLPPKLPPPGQDMRGRIVGRETQGGRIKLTIGLGINHGVRVDMPGHMLTKSGRPAGSFTIDEVHDVVSFAYLDHDHHDSILNTLQVVVNPSGGGGGSGKGKK